MPVAVPLVLTIAVLDVMEVYDGRLYNVLHSSILSATKATLDGSVEWPYRLAIRVQMTLLRFESGLAEPVGRLLDAALSSSAMGQDFKPWATTPLPGVSS